MLEVSWQTSHTRGNVGGTVTCVVSSATALDAASTGVMANSVISLSIIIITIIIIIITTTTTFIHHFIIYSFIHSFIHSFIQLMTHSKF